MTVNNPDEEEQRVWQGLLDEEDRRARLDINYIVMQTEQTSVYHYQAMVQFSRPKTHDWIKRNLTGNHHFERIRNAANLKKYCQKERTRSVGQRFEVRGEAGIIRMREYDHMTDMILRQETDHSLKAPTQAEVMHAFPRSFLIHSKGAEKMIGLVQKPRDFIPDVTILYGPTGSGKTWMAMTSDKSVYKIPEAQKGGWWWHNYQHQHRVVLDEFRHNIKFKTMLEFLDRYAFTLEIKGTNDTMNSREIYITSNIPPNKWYPNVESKDPLYRRFRDYCKIYKVTVPDDWDDITHVKQYNEIQAARMVYQHGHMVDVGDIMQIDEAEEELIQNQLGHYMLAPTVSDDDIFLDSD